MSHESPDPTSIPERYADRELFHRVAGAVAHHYDGDASGHDAHHAWRVCHLAQAIADRVEADVDRDVLGVAALVHDVHRNVDGGVPPRESLDEVAAILEEAGVPEGDRDPVLHCVAVHDDYDHRGDPDRTGSMEARILQDADNLDAMGAVGIARNFAFTAVNDNPLWDPTGEDYSGLYHFEDKLAKLPDEMNTDPGCEVAGRRLAVLEEFEERFRREWFGEDL